MIALHSVTEPGPSVESCVSPLFGSKEPFSSDELDDDSNLISLDLLGASDTDALSLLVAVACASDNPDPTSDEDLVSEEQFEMLDRSHQERLIRLLPDVDSAENEDGKLAESALTNKYVSHACKEVQQLLSDKLPASREQYPRKAKLHRKRFFRNRRISESSRMSNFSDDGSLEETGASISSDCSVSDICRYNDHMQREQHEQQQVQQQRLEQLNPLQCLARAAAEVAAAASPLSASPPPPPLPTELSRCSASGVAGVTTTTVSHHLSSVACLSVEMLQGGVERRVRGISESSDAPTRKKRGAGKKLTRAEAQAASGSSARTEGLRRNESSGTPARLAGNALLSKVPANAKVGHLRSRYSIIPIVSPCDACLTEPVDGDSYTVVSSGFDHNYTSFQHDSFSFDLLPVVSTGYSVEHDYARPPALCPTAQNNATAGKRRSLGDLTTLPSMSLSPLMNLKDNVAITLPLPIEPITIEDANLVSQFPASRSLPDTSSSRSRGQQIIPGLPGLASSYSSALSLLAATANTATSPQASPSSSSGTGHDGSAALL